MKTWSIFFSFSLLISASHTAFAATDQYSRQQIATVLEAESRMTTVSESIAVKQSGLSYVQDISDFEYLASYTVSRPSDSYRKAVGDFIASYVGNYVQSPADLPYLQILEARTPTVTQALAVKSAGMRAVRSIQDFLVLISFSVSNPSDGYRKAVSSFVATNVQYSLNEYSPIYLIIKVEMYTQTINDSMAVKNAGLVAVHSKRDLLDLAQFSVSNPSQGYRDAVNRFIRDNISRYPSTRAL